MRDYLYIWNDPINQCVVTSGIHFHDIADRIGTNGGLVLLQHDAEYGATYIEHDGKSNFDYVQRDRISDLAEQSIHMWGNFCWVDYVGNEFPEIPDHEIAHLLFFAHTGRPLTSTVLPSLRNRYLCHIHDDGWFLRFFYASWEDAEILISNLCAELPLAELRTASTAYWISGSSIEPEEETLNPDIVINRHLPRR